MWMDNFWPLTTTNYLTICCHGWTGDDDDDTTAKCDEMKEEE